MDGGGSVGGGGGGAAGGVVNTGAETSSDEADIPRLAAADEASDVAFGARVSPSSALGWPSDGVSTVVMATANSTTPLLMLLLLSEAPVAAASFNDVKSTLLCTALSFTEVNITESVGTPPCKARRRLPTVTVQPTNVAQTLSVIPSDASETHAASQLDGRLIDISVVTSTLTDEGAEEDAAAPVNAVTRLPTSPDPIDGSESTAEVCTLT